MTTVATAENWTEQSPQTAFEPDEEVLKLLAEIGLSAAVRGCGEAAASIFEALALFKPTNPLAAIGRALGDISAGKSDEAIAGLRAAGVMHDTCPDELKAVLLIALCLAGHQVDASLLCRRLLNSGGVRAGRLPCA
ncbi:MAG: hypothetical protein OEU92_34555 [Alphaproteobacteria bacterium]|nr:hypothetical protein [Alphaproteobacteria bacterium]